LALAWAGNRLSAQIIIRDLLKEAQKKRNWKLDDCLTILQTMTKNMGIMYLLLDTVMMGKEYFHSATELIKSSIILKSMGW